MLLPRAASVLTAVTTAAALSIATAALTHAGTSCDSPMNGTYTATADGQWAMTDEVYHDEATVVTTWTVTSSCDDVMHCAGQVTSEQGWRADLGCQAGLWFTKHRVENWQPCADGSTTPGDQTFRFWRVESEPETFAGFDRTIGPSGGCGINLWNKVEMPFTLTKTG